MLLTVVARSHGIFVDVLGALITRKQTDVSMIVISYRRDDSEAITGQIFDRLIQSFGKEAVFRDIDNIPVGSDFRERIGSVLRESEILLVIMGPRWSCRSTRGTPRDSSGSITRHSKSVRSYRLMPMLNQGSTQWTRPPAYDYDRACLAVVARHMLTMIQIARERKAMRTSLYDLSVPTFLQTVRSVGGFLDRAATHFSNTGVDPDNFVNTRLFDDMAPFHFQIEAASHHSVWGVEALKTGAFTPPALVGPVPFTDLQAMIGKAETALEAFVPEEINDCAGKHLDLQIGPRRLAFTSENFILSFSLPNFHFHAVTAYNILRSRGVPLGKRDYEGRLRTSSL